MAKPLDQEADIPFFEVHEVVVPHLGHVPIAKGDFNRLPRKVQKFVAFYVSVCHDVIMTRRPTNTNTH